MTKNLFRIFLMLFSLLLLTTFSHAIPLEKVKNYWKTNELWYNTQTGAYEDGSVVREPGNDHIIPWGYDTSNAKMVSDSGTRIETSYNSIYVQALQWVASDLILEEVGWEDMELKYLGTYTGAKATSEQFTGAPSFWISYDYIMSLGNDFYSDKSYNKITLDLIDAENSEVVGSHSLLSSPMNSSGRHGSSFSGLDPTQSYYFDIGAYAYMHFDTRPATGADNFSDIDISIEKAIPTPEPGTILLLGFGMIGIAGWGKKKFKK